MAAKSCDSRERARIGGAGLAMVAACAVFASGCQETVEIPPVEAKTVEAYGVRLDELAKPEQVVYVLLRSLRDDVEAAQAHDHDRQKEAFRITFSLGAFSEIEKRLARSLGEGRETLGRLRDRRLYDVINHWAPIVGHYVHGFDLEEETAVGRMRTSILPDGTTAMVLVEVAHDPSASDPREREAATIEVTLAREKATVGSGEFWRVARVAFRGPPGRPASRPADAPPAGTNPAAG